MKIAWKVLEDGERLSEGSFAVGLLFNGENDKVTTRGVQLVPLVRVKARALLQQQETEGDRDTPLFVEFPINIEELAIDRAVERLQRTGDGSADGRSGGWTCRLELLQKAPLLALNTSEKSWFDTKIHRAAELRARGNEAFKSEKYKTAIRYYKKVGALRILNSLWLAFILIRIIIGDDRLCDGSSVQSIAPTTRKKPRSSVRSHWRATTTSPRATPSCIVMNTAYHTRL